MLQKYICYKISRGSLQCIIFLFISFLFSWRLQARVCHSSRTVGSVREPLYRKEALLLCENRSKDLRFDPSTFSVNWKEDWKRRRKKWTKTWFALCKFGNCGRSLLAQVYSRRYFSNQYQYLPVPGGEKGWTKRYSSRFCYLDKALSFVQREEFSDADAYESTQIWIWKFFFHFSNRRKNVAKLFGDKIWVQVQVQHWLFKRSFSAL